MTSAKTIDVYNNILRRLAEQGFTDDILQHNQKEVVDWVYEYGSPTKNMASCCNLFSAILYGLKKYPDANVEPYKQAVQKCKEYKEERANSQKLSPNKDFITWDEVIALEKKVKSLPMSLRLLYGLYTYIPPIRADYTPMIIKYRDDNDIVNNYMVIRKKNCVIVLNHYKTAGKYGRVVFQMPEKLSTLVKEYLKESDKKAGDLLLDFGESNLSLKVTNMFRELTGKGIGISLLRHAYITKYLSVPRSIKEKNILSNQMLHSVKVQEQYAIF